MFITSAETEPVVMVSLRHGTAPASLGADDDLAYLVTRVRAAWPNVRIHAAGRDKSRNNTTQRLGVGGGAPSLAADSGSGCSLARPWGWKTAMERLTNTPR